MTSHPPEVTSAAFFINEAMVAFTYTNMLNVNVEQLLADCGGNFTFDSACSR